MLGIIIVTIVGVVVPCVECTYKDNWFVFEYGSMWYILYSVSLLINFVNVMMFCWVTWWRENANSSIYNVTNDESWKVKAQLFLLNIGFFVLCVLNLLWFALFPHLSLVYKCTEESLNWWKPDSSNSAFYIWIKTIL